MRRALGVIAGCVVAVLVSLGVLELGLRAVPGAIPLALLHRFQTDLREEIALRRALPVASRMQELERDDGGPPLRIPAPHTPIVYDFHEPGERGRFITDAQGFCNPPRDDYARSELDLIAVGDSFTWCLATPPEQTWLSRLGRLTGLAVYNLGRGGIGPYEYLQILRHFGVAKRPQVVLMNFYEGNDLRDALRYWEHADPEGKAATPSDGELEIDTNALLDGPLARHSVAVNLLVTALAEGVEAGHQALRRATGNAPPAIDFRYRLRFSEATLDFNVQNTDRDEVRVARELEDGQVDLEVLTPALERFVALSRQYGFQPVVTYSPSAYTAYSDFVEFDDASLSELMAGFSRTQRAFLAEQAEEQGYTFVDLTPALQEAARRLRADELLYYRANLHFTPTGHRVVAEHLARTLGTTARP